MFRDGHYLEVIKASDNCLATAVVTVEEKTIEIKKKKVSTNKWLDLEDWAALYKVLERAVLKINQNNGCLQDLEKCEWKKSTRQLDITYKFDSLENVKDTPSLPTIRVTVSPAKKKPEKLESLDHVSKSEKSVSEKRSSDGTRIKAHDSGTEKNYDDSVKKTEGNDAIYSKESKRTKAPLYLRMENLENEQLEEYVPDAPTPKKLCSGSTPEYVPSKKSALAATQISSNVYTPTTKDNKPPGEDAQYVPYSVGTSKVVHEEYDPCAVISSAQLTEEYIPNSKGVKCSVEEYQPDFTSKLMKFDDSYVPSSVESIKEKYNRKSGERLEKMKSHKHSVRRKGDISHKKKINLFS